MENDAVVTFEKVDFNEFAEDMKEYNPTLTFTKERLQKIYDDITLPSRFLTDVPGLFLYPFYAPIDYYFTSKTNDGSMEMFIPTGIKCKLEYGYYLTEAHIPYATTYSVTARYPEQQSIQGKYIVYPEYDTKEKSDIILMMHLYDKKGCFRVDAGDPIFYAVIEK